LGRKALSADPWTQKRSYLILTLPETTTAGKGNGMRTLDRGAPLFSSVRFHGDHQIRKELTSWKKKVLRIGFWARAKRELKKKKRVDPF